MKRYNMTGSWEYGASYNGEWVRFTEVHQIEQERDALKAELAASIAAREEMQLGGNRMAESLRFAREEIADLKAELAALKSAFGNHADAAAADKGPITDAELSTMAACGKHVLRKICDELVAARKELAALKEPYKVLEAEEVREVGYYWWSRGSEWEIVEYYPPGGFPFPDTGAFIGPIKAPGV